MTLRLSILFALAISCFLLDLILGSVAIPLWDILKIIVGETPEKESWTTIIWQFRMPRAITAALAGAGLSVSGLMMQTLFRNPIAGPFVLGISSGASLGVAILLLASSSLGFLGIFNPANQWSLVLFASMGAAMVLLLVLAVSWRVRDVATLLIVGLMFGSATGAIVTILEYFSSQEALKHFIVWSFGSLSGVTWAELYVLIPVVALCLVGSFALAKILNGLLLGDNYARSMGISIQQNRIIIIIITAILAGSITAFCGPIAFIGIAIPHLARMGLQTQQHQVLVPATILLGVAILCLCDVLAQLPHSDQSLPINAITAILGAPLVVWIALKR